MLDALRNRGLTSVVYGVVILATVVVFVIQFNPSAGKRTASLKQACVATVKGWCVDPKDHAAAYRLLIPRDRQGNLLTGKAKQMGIKRIALDGLVERELLVNEAERLGLTVTDEEITQSIYDGFVRVSVPSDNPQIASTLRIPDGRIYAGFRDPKTKLVDVKVYERTIRSLTGRSPAEFREEQGREILAAKMRGLVRAPVRVSDSEAFEAYVRERTSATVRTISVKIPWVARWGVTATAKEVEAWAAEKDNVETVAAALKSRSEEDSPKDAHLRHILVKVSPSAPAEDKSAALGRLAEALARIDAGEPFAEVARDVSDDTGSATRGGDVGDKTDGFVVPFKKAADALKPGEMTRAAIETQFGYHLILRDDPAKAAALETGLKKSVPRSLFVKTKATDEAKRLAERIAKATRAGKSGDDAIKAELAAYVKPAATVPPLAVISSDEATPAKDTKPGDAGVAKAGDASVGDAGAPAPKVAASSTRPAIVLPTADTDPARPRVETSNAFNQGGDPVAELSSDDNRKVLTFAFASKDGEVMPDPLKADNGFIVVQLKERKKATRDEFEKDKDSYLEMLLAAKRAEALALYVKRLREGAKTGDVKIDDSFLKEPEGRDGGAPSPSPDFEEDDGQ